MTQAAVATLENVSKVYRAGNNEVHALKSVTMNVLEREYMAIVGPSGSGKSTLLNILGCLDTASAGHYELFNHTIEKLSRAELADLRGSCIGFVFQSFNLLPRLTAFQNVELPLIYRGWASDLRHERVERVLTSLGMMRRADHLPVELSGGEQQRVAIARALVGDPKLLIADEPTGNLDQARGEEVMQIFKEFHNQGQTIILVTHDLRVARAAERVVEIQDGMVLRDDPQTR